MEKLYEVKRLKMKIVLKILAVTLFVLPFFLFRQEASAVYDTKYTVTEEGGEYKLFSSTSDDIEPVITSNSISDILNVVQSISKACEISFCDVNISESITLKSGDIILSGEVAFNDFANFTIDGASVILDDINLNMNSSGIRVKRGTLDFSSGVINSFSENAITLDHSSGASFYVRDGSINSSSESAAILLKQGTVGVFGGNVTNELGVAVNSSSTLILSGTPSIKGDGYDILTDMPITLSDGETTFSGELRMKYDALFQDGFISCVAYNATESAISGISFYDKNGNSLNVDYFLSHSLIDESNFAAIYLPYTVNYICDGTVVETIYRLHGEKADPISSVTKEGYEFVGWKDADRGEFFEFSAPITDDTDIYAEYKLRSPTYTMCSFDFSYDGTERRIGIDELSHPLISDAIVSYSWYKDGKILNNYSDSVYVQKVADSGEYYCVIEFSIGGDSVSITTAPTPVKISRCVVEIPQISAKYFNGEIQYPEIYSNNVYEVEKKGGTYAGIYPIKLKLKDEENYCFEDDITEVHVDFQILKAENSWIDEIAISDVYTGMQPSAYASAKFGEVYYIYSDKINGEYNTALPCNAGKYFVKAIVDDTENYTALESTATEFFVIQEEVSGLSLLSFPTKSDYVAFDEFCGDGVLIGVSYNSGRYDTIDSDACTVSYQSSDSLRFGDTVVYLAYGGKLVSIRVSVTKATYNISDISFSDTVLEYDSERKTIDFLGELPTGKDGIKLGYYLEGGGTEVGKYDVTLIFVTESNEYQVPAPMSAILEILPREAEVIWNNTKFVYDGEFKCPSAYYLDIHGRKIIMEVEGGRSYAGSYLATAKGNDRNYLLTENEKSFIIEKADYDFSEILWTSTEFIYDAQEKRVELSGLPSGVSVIGYLNNRATESGEYTAVATLAYDENNYNQPKNPTLLWKINRAEYDLGVFSFSDYSTVYDGELHYPIFSGELPVGKDGIALEYSFGEGALHVREGGVEVEITFQTESKNYIAPQSITRKVYITPKEISVEWGSLEFVYSKKPLVPSAFATECEVYVSGANENAGTYTATCKSLDSDFVVINDTAEFVIKKADNEWIKELKINDIYFGQPPSPNAVALGGNVIYRFYSDKDCDVEISISDKIGVFYVRAFCYGDHNYKPIESNIVSFEIIEVVPSEFSVVLLKEIFIAYESILPENITAKIKFNNGEEKSLAFDDLKINYECADSFRASDLYFDVEYLGFSYRAFVEVLKKDYDLSQVKWAGLTQVYDATEKLPYLTGLPEGVDAKYYTESGAAIDAGEYLFFADFDYDSENYNKPSISSALMNIEKQTVILPEIPSIEYCGKNVVPNLPKSELYSFDFIAANSAGQYDVILKINDDKNYVFENGNSMATAKFIITPIVISVRIEDVDLYRDEREFIPTYAITEGQLLDGDELICEFLYDDDVISARFDNENYYVIVTPGRINRIESLSPEGFNRLLLMIFAVMTGTLVVITIIVNRKRLYRYYKELLCRSYFTDTSEDLIVHSDTLDSSVEDTSEIPEESNTEEIENEALNTNELLNDAAGGVDSEDNAVANSSESILPSIIDAEYADSIISDSLARDLIRRDDFIETSGKRKGIVNVDTLSRSFESGQRVDINILKQKSLIPYDTAYIKVLARGMIDKPLTVYANDFSLSAVKMIALSGGKSIKVSTCTPKQKNSRNF